MRRGTSSTRLNTEGDNKAVISVGDQGWTMPIPIAKRKTGWQFDLAAGADEMRTRRIGRNELATIQAILAYFDAQREYAIEDHDGNGVREYARKFVSTKGKKDGLYWESPLGIDESPLGPLLAQQKPKGPGYYGYHYKILTGQGKDAPGGAYDYIIGGRMRSGFAAIAWPVRYGDTGVMAFMVSHAGIVLREGSRAQHRRGRTGHDALQSRRELAQVSDPERASERAAPPWRGCAQRARAVLRTARGCPWRSGAWAGGSESRKLAPLSRCSATNVPPWARAMRREIGSPSPRPLSLVVKNGSKIRSSCWAGMPGPVSLTTSCTLPS